MRDYAFYVYILSNPSRSVLYIGYTANMTNRLLQHIQNKKTPNSFASRYNCGDIVYFEVYQYVSEAIAREKQLKKWSRTKKEVLIKSQNPDMKNFNLEFKVD